MDVDLELNIDFKAIANLKNNPGPGKAKLELELREQNNELEHLGPQTRGPGSSVAEKTFQQTLKEFENSRDELKKIRSKFNAVKQKRLDLFMDAYEYIEKNIDIVYKELTKTRAFPVGGTAYLSLENLEEPYLNGIVIKFNRRNTIVCLL